MNTVTTTLNSEMSIDELMAAMLTKKETVKKAVTPNQRQIRNAFLLTKKDVILNFAKTYKKTHSKIIPLTNLRVIASKLLAQVNLLKNPFNYEYRNGKKNLVSIVNNDDILNMFTTKKEFEYLLTVEKFDIRKAKELDKKEENEKK